MRRPCLDCGTPAVGTRCSGCARAKDRARGSRQARGYDRAHELVREQLEAMLPYPCGGGIGVPYCGEPVRTGSRWVAAHVVDGQPELGYVPAHAACNERAKGRAFRAERPVAAVLA